MEADVSVLELKVPPVVLFILCMLMVAFLGRHTTGLNLPQDGFWDLAFWVLIPFSASVLLLSQWQFFRGGTSVNPVDPQAASRLLTGGIFAVSRNPIYLSMLLILVGFAWRNGQAAGLLAPLVFFLWITRWQIIPEERVLREKFGEEYVRYCARVRRWL